MSSSRHHHHHHTHHHHHRDSRSSSSRLSSSQQQQHETMHRLNLVLKQTVPDIRQVSGHCFLEEILGKPVHKWDRLLIGLDCDEVIPNIYIGNRGAAENKVYLQRLGITHVLNTAEGKTKDQVNTGQGYYKGTEIEYMGLNITDTTNVHVDQYFEPAAKFIHDALEKKGKVFVHCLMGMSRSGAMVMSYMMIKLGMSAEKALTTVRTYRDIRPNYGFLRQLVNLEQSLEKKVHDKQAKDVENSESKTSGDLEKNSKILEKPTSRYRENQQSKDRDNHSKAREKHYSRDRENHKNRHRHD